VKLLKRNSLFLTFPDPGHPNPPKREQKKVPIVPDRSVGLVALL
jgi:hypothetical protein